MTASLGSRRGGTNSDPRPRRRRSDEFRFGARRRARLLMSSWCFSNKDSATMARTPPGRMSLAMVANRWMARMSRCIIDTNGSTMRGSHKTARADPSMRGFANSPWTRWSRINLAVGNAESLPVPDESQDAVTSIFLFHELPPRVRRIVLRECARVLKPGGRLVLVDSLQRGDQPDYERLLGLFPQNYHEPYYESYSTENFGALAASCGLTPIRDVQTFVSKVMVFDRPE